MNPVHTKARMLLMLFCSLLVACSAHAQLWRKLDSVDVNKLHFTQNRFINNIFQQAVNSVRRTPDAGPDDSYLNGKSEDPYLPYQGKIIRHITVKTFNFDRSFTDTNQRDNSTAARIGNRLHISTRKFVVRNNLFIKENTPLNAYKVADNERYIRSLGYINDARIVIDSLPDNPDSVDITVYTKDLFSIAGGAAANGVDRINGNLYDANLAGMGQRLEVTGLYDRNREPIIGYGASYRKDNVGGSFIDATVGYSVMNVNPYTHAEESTEYLSLSRRLVSPYSRFAGGLTISHNESYNIYRLPDSLHNSYKYNLFDAWAGYSIGIKLLTATNNTIRDRRFLAIRYYNRDFTQEPKLVQASPFFDPVFNSSQAILAQFTFFRQDYYKTQYVYGFGTTEDLPYGYNIAATIGLHRQSHNGMVLERPYAGVNASQYVATNKGDFIQFYLRTGGFLHNGNIQDGSYLVGATGYSRIFFLNSTKIRQYINVGFTQLYNRTTYAPLRINNEFGPRGFLSDSAYGTRRLSLQLETAFYLKYKFLGFQFAPFPYGDLTLIAPEKGSFIQSALYTSLGGGIRARNQNLVFETIEIRSFFFPAAPANMRGFKVVVSSNIRFRYSSNYITAPDLVRLNNQ
jgi:hypothetical protein